MGTGDLCRVPPAAVHRGRARHCSGTGPYVYCRRVPRGQYSGKIRFIEKPGVQDEGVAMWLNVVLTPGWPTLSYFQVGGMKHDQELYAKVSYIPSA